MRDFIPFLLIRGGRHPCMIEDDVWPDIYYSGVCLWQCHTSSTGFNIQATMTMHDSHEHLSRRSECSNAPLSQRSKWPVGILICIAALCCYQEHSTVKQQIREPFEQIHRAGSTTQEITPVSLFIWPTRDKRHLTISTSNAIFILWSILIVTGRYDILRPQLNYSTSP